MAVPKIIWRIGFWLLVAFIVFMSVFPFYYAIVTSFKKPSEIFQVSYWPTSFSLENYKSVLTSGDFLRNIWNSIVVAVSVVALAMLMGITAAYALARVRFRGRGALLLIILGVSMFPQVAVLSGLFELVSGVNNFGTRVLGINLSNTHWALVFSYTIFTLPFTVWVLTTFMRDLPMEIEEAAIVDGATPWQIVSKVFLPLMWPALVTTGLLAFIAAWNEFLFALTFTSSASMRTVPVGIALLSGSTQYEVPWGNIMAASVIVTLPIILLVLAFQRKIVSGLTAGGVKG